MEEVKEFIAFTFNKCTSNGMTVIVWVCLGPGAGHHDARVRESVLVQVNTSMLARVVCSCREPSREHLL